MAKHSRSRLTAESRSHNRVQVTLKAGTRPTSSRARQKLDATLNIDQVCTGDLGGKATTAEFTQALVSRIANG